MSTKLQYKNRCEKAGEEFIDDTLDSVGRTPVEGHYVKNADLLKELMWCKEHNGGRASDKLSMMFVKIATKLSNRLVYVRPEDREDCVYFAVMDCLMYFHRFDPAKSTNAFAYVTSMCTNGFAKGWRKLGKMKFPDSIMLSLSDNIYSI